MKIMRKINERKVQKMYMSIIKIAQSIGEPEWTQVVETNKGNIIIDIKIRADDKPESV